MNAEKREISIKNIVVGILIVCVWILAFLKVLTPTFAFLAGIVFTLIFGTSYGSRFKSYISWLLKVSVIGLGFGISIQDTIALGKTSFLMMVLSIVMTIVIGILLIKILGLDKKLGFLLSSGTAICGGSAIAAVAPIAKADSNIISISIAVVFSLNAVALLIFPSIGHFLGLTQSEFGIWCALAIHDTSSVVGAAMEYGDEALKVATTVKLARTLWIIPLSLFAILYFKSGSKKIKIPLFILGFIAAMVVNSQQLIPNDISSMIVRISKSLLVLTLFLVGTTLTLEKLKQSGSKPLMMAVILWVFISVVSLILILNLQV